MSAAQERVAVAVAPAVAAAGLDLEEVSVVEAGRRRVVTVVVDSESGASLEAIAAASQGVSDALDASAVLGERPYVLEVTSPGVDRPLTLPRHWRRNAGRLVAVTLVDGERVEARIGAVDDAGVDVVVERRATKGGPLRTTPRRLEFADVAIAVVQVEFNRAEEAPEDGPA